MTRPPLDIREDIAAIIRGYPPLRESHPFITIVVNPNGHVSLEGNVRTRIIRRVLIDSTRLVPGVTGINAEALYNDDDLLMEVGRQIPPGVYLTAVNGDVVLSGRAPGPGVQEALMETIKAMPGVREVAARFYAMAPAM